MISVTRSNRFREAGGFTLVELVLVIFICAMLAVLVFPAVRRNWGDLAKSTSASDLVRLLRHTRLKSANDDTLYRVVLEESGEKILPAVYRVSANGSSEKVEQDWAIPSGELEALFVSSQTQNIQALPEIEFDRGRVHTHCWVVITDGDRAKSVISISAPSGVVSILPPGDKTNLQELGESLPSKTKNTQELAASYWQNNCGKVFE